MANFGFFKRLNFRKKVTGKQKDKSPPKGYLDNRTIRSLLKNQRSQKIPRPPQAIIAPEDPSSPKARVKFKLNTEGFKKGDVLLLLCFLFLLAVVANVFYLMSQPAKLVIFKNDNPNYDPNVLLQLSPNFNLWEFDSFSETSRLNSLPWVKRAKLKKIPPQILGYYLESRKPVVVLAALKRQFLVAEDLVLIGTRQKGTFQQLPLLKLQIPATSNLEPGYRFDDFLLKSGLAWIKQLENNKVLPLATVLDIDISDPYDFKIRLTKNRLVRVTYNDIPAQLQRLELAGPFLAQDKNWRKIDLRVTKRVIISK